MSMNEHLGVRNMRQPVTSQPLVMGVLDALNLIRAGNTLGPIRVLKLALRNNPQDENSKLGLRVKQAINWLENKQTALAIEVLTGNDRF
jgi:hypothetical protein